MMVNPDNRACNVADQEGKNGSVLEFWKRVIKLRKESEVLVSAVDALSSVDVVYHQFLIALRLIL